MRIGIPELEKFNPKRGIGRFVSHLVSEWKQAGHEVLSLSPKKMRLPVLRNMNWGLETPLSKVDVIFLPNFLGGEILFFIPKDFPTVTVVHDIGGIDCAEDISESTLLTQPFYRLALKALSRSTQLVTISDFTKKRLCEYNAHLTPKVTTAYNGVVHETFFPQERLHCRAIARKKGIPLTDKEFVVIYVGAEYARKNLSTLIDSFSILKQRIPHAKLLKVGAAHSLANRSLTLQKIKQKNLLSGRDVIFIAGVEDEFLATLYCCADVFVSTSKYEGFGLPLLEAMACGVPAVVSHAGAFPEVGGDVVTYVEPDNAYAFAKRIEQVGLSQNLPQKQALSARAAQFQWSKTADSIAKILQSAILGGNNCQTEKATLVSDVG